MTEDPDDIRAPHLRHGDFLGAFGVLERPKGILMVQNRRVIGGRDVLTWDLPGGQVEPGESLTEALARELDEEIGIEVRGEPPFLFYQEGERVIEGERHSMWRSFFYEIAEFEGEPWPQGEIVDMLWMPRAAMRNALTAPYHQSFLDWLDAGDGPFWCTWAD